MTEENTDREQGVNFTQLGPILDDIDYPISADELLAEHGDHAINRTNAEPITLRTLFESAGDETFESAEAVQQGILNLMPEASVGREEYSNRGGSHPEATEEADDLEEEDSL